jgi:hypothetical protein
MGNSDLERHFPGLVPGAYKVTSPSDPQYNCAGWAAGETHRWWDPTSGGGYYWPAGVAQDQSVAALIAVFATLQYQPCSDPRLEPEAEKLAIYADAQGLPTHVARQLLSGAWTSKLGGSEDVEHATLAALEGGLYGKVVQCLRRQINQ